MRWLAAICLALWGVVAGAQDRAPTSASIVTRVETGLALLDRGDLPAAYARLNAVNELAQDHRPGALATFYPNAALALYFHDAGRYDAALRFAASAVAGLTSHGLGAHRARHMASVVLGASLFRLGRLDEAETTLRAVLADVQGNAAQADLYGMALHYLARSVSRLRTADEVAVRRAFLEGFSEAWRVAAPDVLQVRYLQLQYEDDRGADPADLLPRLAALVSDADRARGVSESQRSYYAGYYGYLLARVGEYAAAEAALRRQYDVLRRSEQRHDDVWENARRLAEVMVYTKGAQGGYDFLRLEVQRAEALEAPVNALALYHRDLGRIAGGAGNVALAQTHFRDAYAVARGAFPATSALALHLRRFLDPEDGGMTGYRFRAEVAAPEPEVTLRADGAHVLYLFLQGRHVALGDWFARVEPGQGPEPDPALYHINRALYRAMIGQSEGMVADLRAARAAAQDQAGSALHPQAAVFDVIHAIGFAWGTEHDPARARSSVSALAARGAGLSPGMKLLIESLSVYVASQTGDKRALVAGLDAWAANPVARAPEGPWEIFANVLALEMAHGNRAPATLAPIEAGTFAAMGEGYALLRAINRLSVQVLAQPDGVSDTALADRARVERALSDMLPPSHPVLASARFALATAHQQRGEDPAAVTWLDKAIGGLRAAPHARRDRLAYLLARKGRLLASQGQLDEALAQTSDALAIIGDETGDGTYLGEVLTGHAETLWLRTRSAAKLEAFLAGWVDRSAVMASLLPEARADLLILRGFAATQLGGDAEPVFAQARAVMSSPIWDWRTKRSRLDQLLAEYRYRAGNLPGAWQAVTRSTDAYAAWVADGAGAVRAQKDTLRKHAVWEGAIGWALAEGLRE